MKIVNKMTGWIKLHWSDIIGMYVGCLFTAVLISSIYSNKQLPGYFNRIELIDSMNVVNAAEMKAYKDSLVMVDVFSTLYNIESKLEILNSRPIIKMPVIDTLYMVRTTNVEQVVYRAPTESRSSDSLLAIIEALNSKVLEQQIEIVRYSDSVNTYRSVVADKVLENMKLIDEMTKHKRNIKILSGVGIGEAIYIGLRTARVF